MNPFREALEKHLGRQVVVSGRSASEWADVPGGLRDYSYWLAKLENARHVQGFKDAVTGILNPQQVRRADRVTPQNPEGFVTEGLNYASARARLKQLAASLQYQPPEGKAGTIQDISSDGRINLVLRMGAEKAYGFGQFLQGQDPAVLDQWPAQELFRAEERKEERPWPTIWMSHGGQIFNGRMIALKNDPIWEAISEFGNPWPPYRYGSGMWTRDVDRDEAKQLGLLQSGQEVKPVVEDFNAKLQASVKDIDPELLKSLEQSFGGQMEVVDGIARWVA